jgi:vitamin B12 transporter
MKIPLIAFALAYSFLLSVSSVSAQELKDSVYLLREVPITAGRLSDFTAGNKIQDIDSAALSNYQGGNLGEVLAQQSQIFIKTYSPGMLATTSFRGATAEQTAILWHGFNITNPMLGQLDLSLLPVDFIQDVKLQYGGSSALFGSGAIGGTVHLDNTAPYDKGLTAGVSSSFGSFNSQQQGVHVQLSEKSFICSFKLFERTAENNFRFADIAEFGSPVVNEKNAAIKQFGLMQENYFRISKNQEINLRLWYENTDRELPPTMTEQDTTQRQKDFTLRVTSQWKCEGEHSTLFVRAAYFDEQLNYFDPGSSITSLSHFRTLIAETEDKIRLSKNQLLNIGFNSTAVQANLSEGYANTPQQEQNSLFCSYKYNTSGERWIALVNVREEAVNTTLTPFTPSLGLERKVFEFISLKGNVSRNYRVPTFNELYYVPGGNPALKPEEGWSEEAGLYLHLSGSGYRLEGSATAYNSKTENLITWLPPDPSIQQNNWYDANISSVWSRGCEYMLGLNLTLNSVNLQLSGMYNLVLSTNPAGQQLIYVPAQCASGTFAVGYKKINFTYNHSYTGYRYETTDNTAWLFPYQVGNVMVSKVFKLKNTNLKFFVRVNNVWNQAYQVIAWYAMPLRNYQLGISIDFNKPNSKS